MKILRYIITCAFVTLLFAGCEKGIDPISKVDPGPDQSAPSVTIKYPIEGTLIRLDAPVVPIKIQLVASDDIELATIVVKLDGTQIATFNSFKDYRRAMEEYTYNNLTDGDHVLSVTASDLAGKSTTASVNFKKTTPYHPLYEGEVFYMPFDGDYMELVTNKEGTLVGTPSFVDGKKGKAYAGATDAYVTFPSAGLLGSEFSVSFWYKLNGTPPRGGILSISRAYTTYNDSTRRKGFRMARENSGTKQNLFNNLGVGKDEVWVNPFIALTQTGNWVHIAISINSTEAKYYVDNQLATTKSIKGPIDWTDCNLISIMSGKPNFGYWDHFSDLSQMDELRLFNKAITAAQVAELYAAK